MTMHVDWEHEILTQLDNYARRYDFPILNNIYHNFVEIDLCSFRSNDEWLIIFQLVNITNEVLMNDIYGFGNRLTQPGMQRGIMCTDDPLALVKRAENGQLWITGDLYGQKIQYELAIDDLQRAKVEVDNVDALAAFRALAVRSPSAMMLDDQALLEICGRSTAAVLQWAHPETWYHPDVADDELPSSSDSLVKLAQSLARGTPLQLSSPRETNLEWQRWVVE